jgi:hypothetical protein
VEREPARREYGFLFSAGIVRVDVKWEMYAEGVA